MYRAFKIEANYKLNKLLNQQSDDNSKFEKLYSIVKKQTKPNLEPKLLKMINYSSLTMKSLDADSIWNEWFPRIEVDVFISHSSKDTRLAKSLARWLNTQHQLTSFIDSEIWGHSDELLKEVDNIYCLNRNKTKYLYKNRNGSTAHVHMMLSYALTRMIERTECFIFSQSHNSATVEESVNGTYSPWVFHELATVDTIEPKKPMRLMNKITNQRSVAITESLHLKIKYPLLGKRLRKINPEDLLNWARIKSNREKSNSLDILYQMLSIENKDQ